MQRNEDNGARCLSGMCSDMTTKSKGHKLNNRKFHPLDDSENVTGHRSGQFAVGDTAMSREVEVESLSG